MQTICIPVWIVNFEEFMSPKKCTMHLLVIPSSFSIAFKSSLSLLVSLFLCR